MRHRTGATLVTLVGAALAQAQGIGNATPGDVPLAECHDMTLSFAHVTYQSYDVVVQAVVTRPGLFQLGSGHGYFGTSDTPADPDGVLMTATDTVLTGEAGSDAVWDASCVGGSAHGVLHVPANPRPPAPPRITLRGATVVPATSHQGAADPLRGTATDNQGAHLPVRCSPAVLPVTPRRTTVTCSARDAAGLTSTVHRVVTVLGADAQLAALRDSLPPGRLRDLVEGSRDAVVRRDGPFASRRLGLVLDEVHFSGLPRSRAAQVRTDVARIARVLDRPVPSLHTVRAGDSIWSVVRDALVLKAGPPTEHQVAAGVRLVLAVNPGALDRHGVLLPGKVLALPL